MHFAGSSRDGGAAVVEYAVVLSVLVGAVLAVLPALGATGSAAVQRQASCMAERPAVAMCEPGAGEQAP
jgi:Flp pilus assembly pilin Flp